MLKRLYLWIIPANLDVFPVHETPWYKNVLDILKYNKGRRYDCRPGGKRMSTISRLRGAGLSIAAIAAKILEEPKGDTAGE